MKCIGRSTLVLAITLIAIMATGIMPASSQTGTTIITGTANVNGAPAGNVTVSAGGQSTNSLPSGFYILTVPSGVSTKVTASYKGRTAQYGPFTPELGRTYSNVNLNVVVPVTATPKPSATATPTATATVTATPTATAKPTATPKPSSSSGHSTNPVATAYYLITTPEPTIVATQSPVPTADTKFDQSIYVKDVPTPTPLSTQAKSPGFTVLVAIGALLGAVFLINKFRR